MIFLVFISAVFVLAGCGDDDEADDKKDSPAVNSYLTCPDENHPHLIDLNLPLGTKWACCNVGADKPEAYGGYYAWGETEEKTYYSWSNYTHCDGAEYTSHDIGYNIAGTQYDVAYVKWGESWAMPTLEQVKELLNNSTSTRTTMNGVNGYKITGSNGGNIFLPEAMEVIKLLEKCIIPRAKASSLTRVFICSIRRPIKKPPLKNKPVILVIIQQIWECHHRQFSVNVVHYDTVFHVKQFLSYE